MGTLAEDLSAIKTIETGLVNNKVANFAYTDTAYANDTVNGTPTYDPNAQNNIPIADPSVLKVNSTILQRGWRAKASSITRMLMNHFLGRISYNLNKLNDNMNSLLDTLESHYGEKNGYATLDANGRIPYSQLPESALEYKGDWDASTNTPTLADGTGTLGDMYIVSVAGTQNLGSGNIDFIENDRVIYNGSVWQKLSGGSVRSVNSVMPDGTGNISVSGDDILTTPSVSADLQVTLKDKTIRQVHCKGQAGDQTKILLGNVPLTYSSVFLLTFDTDNTYNSGVIELVFSGGALAGEVLETEYNGSVTSSTNYGIKAGTYIARLVQRTGAPNGRRVAIEGEYCVDSARTAWTARWSESSSGTGICRSVGSATKKVVEMPVSFDVSLARTMNLSFEFLVNFTNNDSTIADLTMTLVLPDGTEMIPEHPLYVNGRKHSSLGDVISIASGTYKCVYNAGKQIFFLQTIGNHLYISPTIGISVDGNLQTGVQPLYIPLTPDLCILSWRGDVSYNFSQKIHVSYKIPSSFKVINGNVQLSINSDTESRQTYLAIGNNLIDTYIIPNGARTAFSTFMLLLCEYVSL